MSEKMELPPIPAPISEFIPYLAQNRGKDMQELVQPYREFESRLREVYAQQPEHEASKTEFFNILPLFAGHEDDITIRARNLDEESEEQQSKYVMPLKPTDRREDGSPAVCPTFRQFQTNFNLFSESSLTGLDWSNIVAAGSSVTTSLMPIPEEHSDSKRSMRTWYHQTVAPASDVDLFIYGLTEEQAVEKMKTVEQAIRDSILAETTTVRTKNAITIASEYPTRHVQIVLRTYKNISEILTGFDVDCACAAYDGKQVYATPRALASFVTQINTVDLTRRSPSYENRLSKYSRRGFEVYWPELERSRIDPTIFERSFPRTQGLARLLVLEKLPTSSERDAYIDQRRRERGRPPANRNFRMRNKLFGNLKNDADDEVAEWVTGDEVSSYHTFTVPYGPKFTAKKIEKLLYTKDLLLNAEWNQHKDREVYLHRHPAFFGRVKHVIGDCCGFCPVPVTEEEKEIAHEEGKIFISGGVEFLHDDPGRQRIGSFHPLTADDWTEMAYVSKTGQLCRAIVECDLETVQKWLQEEQVDPYMRDYTGRTPLHLATMCSTPEIVQALIDHGIRIVARLADGRTALHLAAIRGNVDIVKAILNKSEENEEAEAEKEDAKKTANKQDTQKSQGKPAAEDKEDSDVDMIDEDEADDDSDIDMETQSRGSFVQVNKNEEKAPSDNVPEDEETETPDVYDVNVLAWDVPTSPLHLAIANGHVDTAAELVNTFGADVLLPVKLVNDFDRSPRAAILTLVLATVLEYEEAKAMTEKLLALGASSAQGDMNLITAFHYILKAKPTLIETLIEQDKPAVLRAINHVSSPGIRDYGRKFVSPIMTALASTDYDTVSKMLELGARAEVSFDEFMKAAKAGDSPYKIVTDDTEYNEKQYHLNVTQPIIQAAIQDQPDLVQLLIETGQADVNTLTPISYNMIVDENQRTYNVGRSLLDIVQEHIKVLGEYKGETADVSEPIKMLTDEEYLDGLPEGSYKKWVIATKLKIEKQRYKEMLRDRKESLERLEKKRGVQEKEEFLKDLQARTKELEQFLISQGAKGFYELHPEIERSKHSQHNRYRYTPYKPKEPGQFEPTFEFNVGDLNNDRREAYVKIFEAAWSGDIETIKGYTLQSWGEDGKYAPLEISKSDTSDNTPFSISIYRGNTDGARQILEICHAQYQPAEEQRQRYRIAGEDEEEEVDSDEEQEDFPIYGEIISDRYTVDTIGEVSGQVRSSVTPRSMLAQALDMKFIVSSLDSEKAPKTSRYDFMDKAKADFLLGLKNYEDSFWRCSPLELAVYLDEPSLVEFLLECDMKYKTSTDQQGSFPQVGSHVFNLAIEHGRTEILEFLIRRTGAGIPLDDMVKLSGLEIKEKPQYYPGLSVYGKKRKDWAEAGRAVTNDTARMDANPPIMEAARLGNLKSLEWFLSDSPLRLYKNFATKYKDDKRLKALAETKGGVEQAITQWYSRSAELLVHCCVLSPPLPTKPALIDCALAANSESLHAVSPENSWSPLQLAIAKGEVETAKQLINAGSDQTCRTKDGLNLLHTILENHTSNDQSKDSYDRVFQLIELIDNRVLPSMFCERTREETPRTPLSLWLQGQRRSKKVLNDSPKILAFLLEKSKGTDLTMMDGSGQLPMHQCVRENIFWLLEEMYKIDPSLLFRENATGVTPYEMAENAALAKHFEDPPEIAVFENHRSTYLFLEAEYYPLLNASPSTFADRDDDDATPQQHVRNHAGRKRLASRMARGLDYHEDKKQVWERLTDLKKRLDETDPRSTRRKLVTLTEANEVAKRLAEKKRRQDRRWAAAKQGEEEAEESGRADFVTMWLTSSPNSW